MFLHAHQCSPTVVSNPSMAQAVIDSPMNQMAGGIQICEAGDTTCISLADYRTVSYTNCFQNPGYSSVLDKGGREDDQWGLGDTTALWESDRIIAQNGSPQVVAGGFIDNNGCCCHPSSSSLAADIAGRMQRELQELDFFVLVQMEKMRLELEHKRRKHWAGLLQAADGWVEAVLRPKEAEIEGIRLRNTALEERIQLLLAEGQAWQALAQTNEAEVAELQRDLEAAQAMEGGGDSRLAPEEASSCHCEVEKVEEEGGERWGRWLCRSCHRREATVLALPCRHLCLCQECDAGCRTCPVCAGGKTASLHVCLS